MDWRFVYFANYFHYTNWIVKSIIYYVKHVFPPRFYVMARLSVLLM